MSDKPNAWDIHQAEAEAAANARPARPRALILASALGLAWGSVGLVVSAVEVALDFGLTPLSEAGEQAVALLRTMTGAAATSMLVIQGPLSALLLLSVAAGWAGRPIGRVFYALWAWLNLGAGAMALVFAMQLDPIGWISLASALAVLLMLIQEPVMAYLAPRPVVEPEFDATADEYSEWADLARPWDGEDD